MRLNFSKLKRRWFLPLSFIATTSSGILMAACSANPLPHTINQIYQKSNIKSGDRKLYAFGEDDTISSAVAADFELKGSRLLEYVYSGETRLNGKGEVIGDNYTDFKISLGLADAVYVTKKDQTQPEVFDTDEVDGTPEIDLIYTGVRRLTSTNPRSVNSKHFAEAIKTATKLQFTIKDDVYWIDAQGNKTDYKVTAEDFYTKYLRTALTETSYRRAHGGSKAADEKAINEVYLNKLPSSNRFSELSKYSNEYLIKLFDVDSEKLKEKNTFLTKVTAGNVQKDAVTMETAANATSSDWTNFLTKTILTAGYFSPAPTEYIKANNQKNNFDGITGIAAESGYYWYGADYSKMLYSSPYYLSKKNDQFDIYTKNQYFYDQAWVNDPKSVNLITLEYIGTDPATFRDATFNDFKDETVYNIRYSALTQNQRNEVNKEPEKFNLNYIKTPDYNTIPTAILWQPNPYPVNISQDSKKHGYAFNDAFALMMWGKSTKDLETKDQDLTSHYWAGDGYIFRAILSQAINYYAFVNEINDNQTFWGSLARPDGLIGGTDAETSTQKHLTDFENQEEYFFYGSDNTKISKTLKQDQDHWANNTNNQKKSFQSANFEQLKTEMEKLLDKFYNTGGLGNSLTDNNKKIEMTFYEGSLSLSAKEKTAAQNAIEVLNSLDSKNRLHFKTEPITYDIYSNIFLTNKSANTFAGWGYDVNTYAGFLGFFFFLNERLTFVQSLSYFADDSSTSTDSVLKQRVTQYPEFTKLAKKFKESTIIFSQTDGAKSITFEQFKNAKNSDLTNLANFMKADTNSKYDAGFSFAKFALDYFKGLTNADAAKLNQEISSLIGFSFNSRGGYTREKIALPFLLNGHYISPNMAYGNGAVYNRFIKVR
ncbi:hypothetical protein J2Z62_000725 [Mycoplasmoides fastidiosum]|uniref:Lipoprotein n=1 Tax=Mycoplasmoides fastidiosum TaxID=92758 RepID=A0ABU0M008_9BACT|nr:hypothetical protein [Mycoplasmoides fastidiosum]MDQ0514287.1 hypothetical protein [Mycoplasmoides fastidiosum]UUD38106.1 hypothetical protein NPA10_01840 [Mycoplasmoides fastidiosum]